MGLKRDDQYGFCCSKIVAARIARIPKAGPTPAMVDSTCRFCNRDLKFDRRSFIVCPHCDSPQANTDLAGPLPESGDPRG
jgi:Zn finger protein HypA/HybF involved in hydrogenase expression